MKFYDYHPMINLVFFTHVITMTIFFNHPVFVLISFICSFMYSVKLGKMKVLVFNLIFSIATSAFVCYYVTFHHFGITTLKKNIIGNNITLESLIYAIVLAFIIHSVMMWFSCVHAVMSTDKIIYLLGRVFPKLSLFVSISLRTIPRIKARWDKVSLAQSCIGKGASQGGIIDRIKNTVRTLSVLITWTLDDFIQTSDSMKSRGYTLKGRTAFSIYRFDNRDRTFVTVIFWHVAIMTMAVLLDQVSVLYNPMIVINKITGMSTIFYLAYASLCLLPMGVEIASEIKFKKLQTSER